MSTLRDWIDFAPAWRQGFTGDHGQELLCFQVSVYAWRLLTFTVGHGVALALGEASWISPRLRAHRPLLSFGVDWIFADDYSAVSLHLGLFSVTLGTPVPDDLLFRKSDIDAYLERERWP